MKTKIRILLLAISVSTIALLISCKEEDSGASLEVTTSTPTSVTSSSATLGGSISGEGVLSAGVVISETDNPDIENNISLPSSAISGSFTVSASGLTESTTYFVRAFALTESGVEYGDTKSFTTSAEGSTEDTTPPTLVSISPDGVENVAVNTTITLTFSEPMDVSTFDGYYLSGNLPSETLPTTIAADGNNIVITPDEDLMGGEIDFYYHVPTEALTDLAGNKLDTELATIMGSFRTINTPLEIENISPSPGGTGVDLNPEIVITFSNDLISNTAFVSEGAFELKNGSGSVISTSFEISGNTVTLTPDQELDEFATTYLVSVTGGLVGTQIRGANGNYLVDDFESSFETVVVSDNYYYYIDGNGSVYLALEDQATTRPNGYRNLDLIQQASTGSAVLWRPIKQSFNGETVYVFVNKLDDDNNFYGSDYPQFLYAASVDDGNEEVYSNRPPGTSTAFYSNQYWQLTKEGATVTNADAWLLHNPASNSYLQVSSLDAKTNTSSGTFEWFISRVMAYE